MRIVIDLLYLLAAVAIAPVALYRLIRHNRYRAGWDNKLGRITRRAPEKRCIWLHAVSVGEVNAARTIVKVIQERFGEFDILISTTTDTGYARATAIFAEKLQVIYFPFDFSWVMSRAFGNIRPALCLLMELEVWPNFVRIANNLDVPVAVLNGRISDRSFSTYKRIRPLIKSMFAGLTCVLAQTDEYARRFRELGCREETVIVSGSLKYDTARTDDTIDGADRIAKALGTAGQRLWVLGGTGNDEEALLLDVYQELKQDERFADLRLVVVPRKPERFDEIAQLIEKRGFDLIRYSRIKGLKTEDEFIFNSQSSTEAVILGDTMGDLRKFYSLATVIFVGRSLVPMGGSDMMEAAALGKCTIFGPHAFNFRQTVDALLAGNGAIRIDDKGELSTAVRKCLTEPAYAEEIARNGRNVIIKNQGATKKTIDQIEKLLTSVP
ncbi:MAG: 3-deoxy-D-manno-octulosonic acid transferase [Sedimentisphaerales bacterium]|nr:3-deoxy-D-manno-octulosonic acid transferase [Sedimentisphaerales bacterium]